MSKNIIAGIDYSMTGPAMCIHTGSEWSVDNCEFMFLDKRKKHHCVFFMKDKQIKVSGANVCDIYKFDVERFLEQGNQFIYKLKENEPSLVAIEGYAYGARGRTFNIGENTGLLKHRLIEEGFDLLILQPGEIKKRATRKGNANKQKMYEAWIEETGINLDKLMDCASDKGPVNDIVDSYYICKLAWEQSNGK